MARLSAIRLLKVSFLLTRFSLVTLYLDFLLFDMLRGLDTSFAWKLKESFWTIKFKEDLEN